MSNLADPASRSPDYEQGRAPRPLITLLKPALFKGGVSVGVLSTSVLCLDIEFSFPTLGARDLLLFAYSSDSKLSQSPVPPFYSFKGGLWWYCDRLYVPLLLRPQISSAYHYSPSMGHPAVSRMLSCLPRTYSWPDMRLDVMTFISGCDSCQQVRIDTKAPVGNLHPLPIPDPPWSVLGISFFVILPLSNGFDSILVVVDHFTKGAHFLPCCESMNAADLASLFSQQVFWLHGFPDKIVSNRGPSFVSTFWLAVQRAHRIQSAPSMAYHLETDGQTEQTNQTMETYLRNFVSHWQDNWADWIPVAEFCFGAVW